MEMINKNQVEEVCRIPTTKSQESELSTSTLKILLQSKTPLVVLDARTSQGDDGKRIPGAKSLTHEASTQEIAALLPRKEMLIVVYCSHAQCGASERLAKRLRELGYSFVLKYVGGIEEWMKQGNPTVTV